MGYPTHPLNPLVKPCKWREGVQYPLQAHDIYKMLGFNHCPPKDFSKRLRVPYDGGVSLHTIHFLAKDEALNLGFKQRAITSCPICGKVVAAGNLNQHMVTMHKEGAV